MKKADLKDGNRDFRGGRQGAKIYRHRKDSEGGLVEVGTIMRQSLLVTI